MTDRVTLCRGHPYGSLMSLKLQIWPYHLVTDITPSITSFVADPCALISFAADPCALISFDRLFITPTASRLAHKGQCVNNKVAINGGCVKVAFGIAWAHVRESRTGRRIITIIFWANQWLCMICTFSAAKWKWWRWSSLSFYHHLTLNYSKHIHKYASVPFAC